MKSAVLVLGIAVLFAGGCGQKSNQQTTPETYGGEALASTQDTNQSSNVSAEGAEADIMTPESLAVQQI